MAPPFPLLFFARHPPFPLVLGMAFASDHGDHAGDAAFLVV
jgi:hypothetical protein